MKMSKDLEGLVTDVKPTQRFCLKYHYQGVSFETGKIRLFNDYSHVGYYMIGKKRTELYEIKDKEGVD